MVSAIDFPKHNTIKSDAIAAL